jgi:hypothetical protein
MASASTIGWIVHKMGNSRESNQLKIDFDAMDYATPQAGTQAEAWTA